MISFIVSGVGKTQLKIHSHYNSKAYKLFIQFYFEEVSAFAKLKYWKKDKK